MIPRRGLGQHGYFDWDLCEIRDGVSRNKRIDVEVWYSCCVGVQEPWVALNARQSVYPVELDDTLVIAWLGH